MKKKLYLFVMLTLAFCGLHAQYVAPSEGVFRIINAEYNAALAENESANLYCAEIGGNTDYEQLWYIKPSGSYYTLQNLASKLYVQTGNIAHEVAYWTGLFPKGFDIVANPSKGANLYNIWDPTYKDPQLGTIGLHGKGKGDKVVRWNSEGHKNATEWKFVSVEVPEEYMKELEKYQEELEAETKILESGAIYEAALAKFFEDKACTSLKAEYAAMEEDKLRSELEALDLSDALVEMTLKIRNDNWSEKNANSKKPDWDSDYAKKFRVQMIEPYSIAGEITEWIGHQGHTNMDNPTGLYANNRNFIYVFVEGEIKEGAELWLTWLKGHTKMPNYDNGYSNGVTLKSGLNIIPFSGDGNALYINYLVHTYDKVNKKFTNKLSNYDDLKVHIVGGHINGYYNAIGDELYAADTDADWMYYEERANLENITVLGRYQILQFELNEVTHTEEKDGKTSTWTHRGLAALFPEELPTSLPENQRINAIVEAWDRIMLSEKMTLGVASKAEVDSMNKLYPRYDATWTEKAEIYNYDGYAEFCDSINSRDNCDYGEYYNHHGLAFGTRSGYMYGSWDHCGYHINTTPSILTAIATEAGPTWGPGHEIGHQHQALFTLNGQMEVTNNLFANISVWYMGMGTSRINGTEGRLEDAYYVYRTGGDLFGYETKHIWVMTQMYYRLWLYYHRAGNNTQFYPRLFELLRKNPMERSYGSGNIVLPGETTSTFFQHTSGKKSYLHFYQLCCEAAQEDLTEFFRAYGYFTPMNDRFVGDYTNSIYHLTKEEVDAAIAEVKAKKYPLNKKALFINDCTPDATYSHDGKTQRSFWDGETGRGLNGELGCYVDFMAKKAITGQYVYTLADLKLSIEGGAGALGFAVYNLEGEILAFSNNHSFVLNQEVSDMLNLGNARVYAVSAAEGEVEVLSRAVVGSENEQLEALREKLAELKQYINLSDPTGDKAGYFIADSIADLISLKAQVEKVIAEKDQSECSYGEWYSRMSKALVALLNNDQARIPMYPNCYYTLFVNDNPLYSISYASAGLRTTSAGKEDYSNQWLLEPAAAEDTYRLKNRESGYYISAANNGARAKAAAKEASGALTFRTIPGEPGQFMLQRTDNANISLTVNSSRQVEGGKGTWLNLTLADDMLGLPEEGENDKVVLYYIYSVDTDNYLYKNSSTRMNGRLSTSKKSEEENFWFYFKKGGKNGDKYRIYNYATGKSITLEGNNYFANKDIDVFVEYTLTPSPDRTGIIVSSDAGYWYLLAGNLAVNDTESSRFKLMKIGEALNTDITETVVETEEESLYYDLTGRIVTKPGKGIYIHNGQKIMFK